MMIYTMYFKTVCRSSCIRRLGPKRLKLIGSQNCSTQKLIVNNSKSFIGLHDRHIIPIQCRYISTCVPLSTSKSDDSFNIASPNSDGIVADKLVAPPSTPLEMQQKLPIAQDNAIASHGIESDGWLSAYIKFLDNISSSEVIIQMMTYLRKFHDFTGLPWWASIVVSTVILRTSITLPLSVYQQYIVAKVELLREEMVKDMQVLAHNTRIAKKKYDWDEETARKNFKIASREHWRQLIERDNCHPGKTVVLVLGQLPLWVALSLAYRNLCAAKPVPDTGAMQAFYELYAQGTFWCPHLNYPDPIVLMPLLIGAINLAITEINALQRPAHLADKQKFLTNFFRGVAVFIVPLSAIMPSGVVLYWMTSSSCALAQNLFLLHPKVRNTFGIPVTPSMHLQPYKRMALLLQQKIQDSKLGKKFIRKKDGEMKSTDEKYRKQS